MPEAGESKLKSALVCPLEMSNCLFADIKSLLPKSSSVQRKTNNLPDWTGELSQLQETVPFIETEATELVVEVVAPATVVVVEPIISCWEEAQPPSQKPKTQIPNPKQVIITSDQIQK